MYSANIRHSDQNGWLHTDKDAIQSNINDDDQSPPSTANTTLLTYDAKVEIINEANQSSVSRLSVTCLRLFSNYFNA